MSFLHAGILAAGLAAVSLPILIHLLMRRRRKPVMWGAMRFVLEAYQKTRRRLLLEQWLLLAARCLLVALIAVALGRPLLGGALGLGSDSGGRWVYLLIDNSLTSGAMEPGGKTGLDRQKLMAREVMATLVEGDRVGVITLASPAERLVVPPSGNLSAVAELVAAIEPTDARADVPAALSAVVAELSASGAEQAATAAETTVILLGDWRAGSVDTESALVKLPLGVKVVAQSPALAGVDNVTVASLVPARSVLVSGPASAAQTVTASLQRSGPGAAGEGLSSLRVKLDGGAVVGEAVVRWAAGQRRAVATVPIALPGDLAARDATLSASIDKDALEADNAALVPIEVRESLRVGLIAAARLGSVRPTSPQELSGGEWMALALRPREDPGLELVELDPAAIDVPQLAALDAVIVTAPQRLAESDWARLRGFAQGESGPGGLLIVTPAGGSGAQTWPDAMNRGMGLTWTIAREPVVLGADGAELPRLVGGVEEMPGLTAALDPLSSLRGELAELVRPVSVSRMLPVTAAGEGATALLNMSDGSTLLWMATLPGGSAAGAAETPTGVRRGLLVYLAAAPELEWTDLPVKPLMVPLVQELVRQGVGRARTSPTAVAGGRMQAPPQTARLQRRGAGAEGESAVMTVDETGLSAEPVRMRSVWEAFDARSLRRGLVVVNPDAAAADTDAVDSAAVGAWLGSATQDAAITWLRGADAVDSGAVAATPATTRGTGELFTRAEAGQPTGPLWLLGALGLALFELALARRASHRVAPARRTGEVAA